MKEGRKEGYDKLRLIDQASIYTHTYNATTKDGWMAEEHLILPTISRCERRSSMIHSFSDLTTSAKFRLVIGLLTSVDRKRGLFISL